MLQSALAFAPLRVAGEQRGPQIAQNSAACVPDRDVAARCVPCRKPPAACQPAPAMLDWGDFLPGLGLQGEFLCFVAVVAARYSAVRSPQSAVRPGSLACSS